MRLGKFAKDEDLVSWLGHVIANGDLDRAPACLPFMLGHVSNTKYSLNFNHSFGNGRFSIGRLVEN